MRFCDIFSRNLCRLCYNIIYMDPSYNNSFGSQASATSSPRRRGLIIAGIILIILAIVAAVAAIVLNMNRNQNNTSITARGQLNVYANQFLNGTNSSNNFENEQTDFYDSFFGQLILSGELSQTYTDSLAKHFDAFSESYLAESDDHAFAQTFFDQYKTILSLISTYYNGGSVTRNDILKVYTSEGAEAAKNYIAEISSKYQQFGSIYDISYYDVLYSWGAKTIDLFGQYDGSGCINDGSINYDCAANNVNDTTQNLNNEIGGNYQSLTYVISKSQEDLYNGIFRMASDLFNVEADQNE